jgi:hypothetical protein
MNNWYAIEVVHQREIVERQRAAEQSRVAAAMQPAAQTPHSRRNASRLLTLVLFTLGRR